MSWLTGRVGNFVRDAQRNVGVAAERASGLAAAAGAHAGAAGAARTADELAVELETQARRVNNPQYAAELLLRWVERSDSNTGAFSLGAPGGPGHGLSEPLSFYQALLRSQALEALLEVCGRQPALRAELLRGVPGAFPPGANIAPPGGQPTGGDGETNPDALREALGILADRLLLPGTKALWPGLLDVLLLSCSAEEIPGQGKAIGGGTSPNLGVAGSVSSKADLPKCGPWAKRALQLVKRSWQGESLPAALRCLDRKLTQLAVRPAITSSVAEGGEGSAGAAGGASDLLRGGGARMSKTAIRAALARDTLRTRSLEADRLKQSVELLCDACARLEAAESAGATTVPEAEKLLGDAGDMIVALDSGVKDMGLEQEDLKKSLSEVSAGLEEQIAEFTETHTSMASKREKLEEERAVLQRKLEEAQRRVEEVDMQLAETSEVAGQCEAQVRLLGTKLRDSKNLYEEQIASSFCRQKRLVDERQRATMCKDCAQTALDVVKSEDRRRLEDVAVQLRRRRSELKRTCAAYLRQERERIEVAVECLGGQQPLPVPPGPPLRDLACAEDPMVEASRAIQDAWKAASTILRRAEPLTKESGSSTTIAACIAAAQAPDALEGASRGQVATFTEAPTEDTQAFFLKEKERGYGCVDCGHHDADWASISFGCTLCVDCAGKHRGLGVHLSFVRSTTMDNWSREQLRRMQMGNSKRFQDFLQNYPELRAAPTTRAALAARYGSRAAGYYRRLLDARCWEPPEEAAAEEAQLPPAPEPDEGHLPDATASTRGPWGVAASLSDAAGGGAPGDADDGDTARSVEEERDALRELYIRYTRQGEVPGSPTSSAAIAATLGGGERGGGAIDASAGGSTAPDDPPKT